MEFSLGRGEAGAYPGQLLERGFHLLSLLKSSDHPPGLNLLGYLYPDFEKLKRPWQDANTLGSLSLSQAGEASALLPEVHGDRGHKRMPHAGPGKTEDFQKALPLPQKAIRFLFPDSLILPPC